MRDIFAAELRLTWHFFSLERDHARALNELAGLGTFVPFLLFAFVFPCLCYNSKTAVQYHMTPIYNSTLTTVP